MTILVPTLQHEWSALWKTGYEFKIIGAKTGKFKEDRIFHCTNYGKKPIWINIRGRYGYLCNDIQRK